MTNNQEPDSQVNKSDKKFMDIALRLSRRGLGIVAPNPAVGCVIVKDGQIVGRGWTAPGGRPHAETESLKRAGENAKSATAYVTLEPCCHHGKTPPCSRALIDAGIKRVVIACEDPNPKVSGKGIKELQAAGVKVEMGLCKKEAEEINAGFFLKIKENRPFVTLKLAVSNDEMLGRKNERTQITGELATAYAHLLRKTHDAIMVGSNTLKIDKPKLTCRLPGLEHTSPLIVEATHDLRKKLSELAEQGVTRLLVEGGTILAQSFLDNGLVDEIIIIKNPGLEIGRNGIPAPKIPTKFKQIEIRNLGGDVLVKYNKD